MNNLRGVKIIYQESKATQPSHLYFLQKDGNYCDAIITSESGAKRKLNINVDLSNYYTKTEVNTLINSIDLSNYYTKNEVNANLSTKLDKGNYAGTAQSLKNEIDSKQKLLSSFDESILIENNGNIEGNVSLFEEYFEQQECELNFTPIQIIAVYQDGIKLSSSEYEIILPKKIKIKEYVDENIQIEYTHLKS